MRAGLFIALIAAAWLGGQVKVPRTNATFRFSK